MTEQATSSRSATDDRSSGGRPGLDGPLSEALVGTRRFFTRGEVSTDLRTLHREGGRAGDAFYRDRWSHDKVVRSTHGVNCTGSCSWKVYVKDGIITWEAQQTDYPSVGPDRPEYEPRGCPRGAAFSWYTYSPTRVRYPYVRGVLLEMYREAKAAPAATRSLAWAADRRRTPSKARRYKRARGKGGLVRASWDEATRDRRGRAGPHDQAMRARTGSPGSRRSRRCRWSATPPARASSPSSAPRCCRFYDWYADLPVASPQVFGDQTDVPESGDWWDAAYLIMWGSQRPGHPHPGRPLDDRGPLPRPEGRRRQPRLRRQRQVRRRVAARGPGHRRGARHGDGARRPQGVLRRPAGRTTSRATSALHRPALPRRPRGGRERASPTGQVPHRGRPRRTGEHLGERDVQAGAVGRGNRRARSSRPARSVTGSATRGMGQWNLDLGEIEPSLTMYAGAAGESVDGGAAAVRPAGLGGSAASSAGCPCAGSASTSSRRSSTSCWPSTGSAGTDCRGGGRPGYDDPEVPYTPAWQEEITSVPAAQVDPHRPRVRPERRGSRRAGR